jgi:hypothetical protein
VHWCAATNPAEPQPHKGAAPVRMRRVPLKRRVLCCQRVEPAHCRVATPTDRLPVNSRSHKCNAATEAAVDTEALVCSGSRCSSP